jgi:hypothetical protein
MAPAPPAAPALVDSTERNAEGWTRAELAQVEALAAEKYAALRKVDIEAEAEKRARDLYKATHGVAA